MGWLLAGCKDCQQLLSQGELEGVLLQIVFLLEWCAVSGQVWHSFALVLCGLAALSSWLPLRLSGDYSLFNLTFIFLLDPNQVKWLEQ